MIHKVGNVMDKKNDDAEVNRVSHVLVNIIKEDEGLKNILKAAFILRGYTNVEQMLECAYMEYQAEQEYNADKAFRDEL